MSLRRVLPALGLAALLAPAAFAQAPPAPQVVATPPDYPRGRISGYIFADVYDNLAGDPSHAYSAAGADSGQVNIDGNKVITRDLTGFQMRRAYFQLDNDLSAKYSTRLRFEADSKSLTSDGKFGLAVKAAYLQIRSVFPRADFLAGLVSTPIYDGFEEFWSYRSIEKVQGDFRGLAPSADAGVQLKGFVDDNHVLGYSALVSNGTGNKPETNRQKRSALALPVRWKDLHLEPYIDYENIHGGQDRATYKFFAGYDLARGSIGWEIVDQVQHRPAASNRELRGNTIFARVAPRPELAAFVRVDLWIPDVRSGKRVDQQLWMAGVDWQPVKDVHIMPNIEAMEYDAKGGAVVPPHHDLQARITFYYRFSRPQS